MKFSRQGFAPPASSFFAFRSPASSGWVASYLHKKWNKKEWLFTFWFLNDLFSIISNFLLPNPAICGFLYLI